MYLLNPMITLGIESTAHTFGVGIIKDDVILANERSAFTTKKGGIIPSKAADHHVRHAGTTIKAALKKAGITIKDINLISYAQSPGLGHCLRIGAMAARTLAMKHKIPLVGVNHCIAHLEIGRLLTPAKDPILLYVSGANTQVIAYESGKYRIFGETLDIGIGNFLDCLARELKLGFPGGPKIYELAQKGTTYIELPYVVKGMDVSFAGILTHLKHKIKEKKYAHEDICFSAQETVFAMMVEVAERALAHCKKKELLLGGGVACNIRLQEMAQIMCKERGARCYTVENQYNVDNGAMIAQLGLLQYTSQGALAPEVAGIDPYVRTDDINVTWR